MQADGLSLDDKRTPLIGEDQWEGLFEPQEGTGRKPAFKDHDKCNIPDILQRWFARDKEKRRARTDQSFLVPKTEIADKGYDLSINRYKEVVYEEVQYDPPKVILKRIKELQKAMDKGINELEGML